MKKAKPLITVVSPVYGCAACLPELCRRLQSCLDAISGDYEIVLVNDASRDGAWKVIRELAAGDRRIRGIDLSRNFGQHHAITAGLDFADGEWVVVMDCDLQDRPEEIIRLYHKALEGFDVVFARRAERQDKFLKKLSSKIFHRVFQYLTEQSTDSEIGNFGIYRAPVIESYRRMRESVRSFPLQISWLGFMSTTVDVEHAARLSGKSSYNLSKLMHLAINSIVAQSNRPLRLAIKFGFLTSFASVAMGLWYVIRYFWLGVPVPGWTSVFVSIWLVAGMLFMHLGFLGIYIGKIYDETKGRPLYVIRDITFTMKPLGESSDQA